MFEKGWQVATAQIAVLIDGSSKNGTTVGAIPGRIICPAAKKRYPKGSSADNHVILSDLCCLNLRRQACDQRQRPRISQYGRSLDRTYSSKMRTAPMIEMLWRGVETIILLVLTYERPYCRW